MSEAGRRTAPLPGSVAAAPVDHLAQFVPGVDDALVFGTACGNFLGGSNFGQTFSRAVTACKLPPVRVQKLTTNRDTQIARALDELTMGGKRRPDPAVTGAQADRKVTEPPIKPANTAPDRRQPFQGCQLRS